MALIGITGATGFLGSHLLRHLAASSGHRIRPVTRSGNIPSEASLPNVQWFKGDLSSPKDCEAFVCDLDIILHFAHATTPISSDGDWPSDALLNVVPTLNLLQAIRDAGRRPHVIYPSSGGTVYGGRDTRIPFRETDSCLPTSAYGIVKLSIEHYLRLAAERRWLTAVVLRIGNPYGVLHAPERRQGFIGIAINQVLRGDVVPLYGNPNNVRDYVHLSDVARMIDRTLVPDAPYEVYNVGSGEGASVLEILRTIEEAVGHSIQAMNVGQSPAAERLISWVVLDVTKARERLGWSPEIHLEQGIFALVNWLSTAEG